MSIGHFGPISAPATPEAAPTRRPLPQASAHVGAESDPEPATAQDALGCAGGLAAGRLKDLYRSR